MVYKYSQEGISDNTSTDVPDTDLFSSWSIGVSAWLVESVTTSGAADSMLFSFAALGP